MFRGIFQKPLAPPMTAGGSWWLSGGIPAANCIAAYQPKGAASLAASYVNLANPGTYDAAPGVAPAWAAATGWTGDGATTYLTTGLTPVNNQQWSAFARYSGAQAANNCILGCSTPGLPAFEIRPECWGPNAWACLNGGAETGGPPSFLAGTMGFAGTQVYQNGAPVGVGIGASAGVFLPLFLLASNEGGAAGLFTSAVVAAIVIYNVTLTAAQVAALVVAMAAL